MNLGAIKDYWLIIKINDADQANISFNDKSGAIQTIKQKKYYLYYNQDNECEFLFSHCTPTQHGYIILTTPIFENLLKYKRAYIFFGGDIPSSQILED